MRAMQGILNKYRNIEYVQYGLWCDREELRFKADGSTGSKLSEDGDVCVKVDSIDNICASDKVTFIKMDIEGAESEALKGAHNVIMRDKPRLAICIYHQPQDFYEIALLVKAMVPEYKLYVRHHSLLRTDTVLYATI